jgi:hypothetical protein
LRPTSKGSSTQNVDPSPALDLTPKRPPLSLTIDRTRANPRPVPFPPATRLKQVEVYAHGTKQTLGPSLLRLVKSG